MKKLLFQSDDYGISDAVSDGILKGIDEGIVRNTGLFVNMPSSKKAALKIKDKKGISVGIDINLVAGNPVTDPKLVPSLVDDKGHFISSHQRLKEGKIKNFNGVFAEFEEDPYEYEQTLLETENQVKRFIELMGRKPAYFHGHSLATTNTFKAAIEVARKYDIKMTYDVMTNDKVSMVPCTWTGKPFPIEKQINTDVETNLLNALNKCLDKDICYYICHCGFIDEELFKETSYTIIRAKDLYAACSPKIKEFIKNNNIELITFEELQKEIFPC